MPQLCQGGDAATCPCIHHPFHGWIQAARNGESPRQVSSPPVADSHVLRCAEPLQLACGVALSWLRDRILLLVRTNAPSNNSVVPIEPVKQVAFGGIAEDKIVTC